MGQWMDEREGCKFHLYVTQVEVGAWVLGWREVGGEGAWEQSWDLGTILGLGNKFGAWEQIWGLGTNLGLRNKGENFRTKVG